MAKLELTCVDCPETFYVTDRAQAFLKEKGWDVPKRCKKCRELKKQRFNSPFKPALDHVTKAEHDS